MWKLFVSDPYMASFRSGNVKKSSVAKSGRSTLPIFATLAGFLMQTSWMIISVVKQLLSRRKAKVTEGVLRQITNSCLDHGLFVLRSHSIWAGLWTATYLLVWRGVAFRFKKKIKLMGNPWNKPIAGQAKKKNCTSPSTLTQITLLS